MSGSESVVRDFLESMPGPVEQGTFFAMNLEEPASP